MAKDAHITLINNFSQDLEIFSMFNDEEFHKVLEHVRGDYRLAFQEWITSQRK